MAKELSEKNKKLYQCLVLEYGGSLQNAANSAKCIKNKAHDYRNINLIKSQNRAIIEALSVVTHYGTRIIQASN